MKYLKSFNFINENWQLELKNRVDYLSNEDIDDLTLAIREEFHYTFRYNKEIKTATGVGLTSKDLFFKQAYYPYYTVNLTPYKYEYASQEKYSIDFNLNDAFDNYITDITKIAQYLKNLKRSISSKYTIVKLRMEPVGNKNIFIEFYDHNNPIERDLVPPTKGVVKPIDLPEWVDEWIEELSNLGIGKKGKDPFFRVTLNETTKEYKIVLDIVDVNRQPEGKTYSQLASVLVSRKRGQYHKIAITRAIKNQIIIEIKK